MNEQRVICVLRLFGQNANVFVFTHLLCSTCAVVMALCSVLILRGVCRGVCVFFSCAWLTVCVPSNVRVSKQDTGESIHLGCRAQFAVAAQ